jgi:hypothetical protein
MKLINLITTESELIEQKNHIQKVFQDELSLDLGPSKLNERVASLLGAKNWNDALWLVNSNNSSKPIVSTLDDYKKQFAKILSEWIEKKLSVNDIKTLVDIISFTVSENSQETEESVSSSSILYCLSLLDRTTDIWNVCNSAFAEFGLFEKDFYLYLSSEEQGQTIKVLQNFISENCSDIDIFNIDKTKAYYAEHIKDIIYNYLQSLMDQGLAINFEYIDTCTDFLKFELNISDHESLIAYESGHKDMYALEIYIENCKENSNFVFNGTFGLWDVHTGQLSCNQKDFDGNNYIELKKPSDIPEVVFTSMKSSLTLFISKISSLLEIKTY